ncbi:NUDIX hydrolase domain-like protein [Dendryphion nanum]|uniref:NUDIX hydrolase domain-like protein n=1 Tax=Dendryphion nanum TaxID=256645 RepID=A0A9P9DLK3_9PLEO|nr:NUDIX hydrolase domain-like protein [Dendryphion nanum]
MSSPKTSFTYAAPLEKYKITEEEYLKQNTQYNILCTGAVIFNAEGKMLLVQRAKEEHAFPNCWEIPGGKVDDDDESILHAVAREVKEETGLDVTRVTRKVGEFGWEEFSEKRAKYVVWRKLIFEVEVANFNIVLDPMEHQDYLYAAEEDIVNDKAGDVTLTWITAPNKAMNLDAFRQKREEATPQL